MYGSLVHWLQTDSTERNLIMKKYSKRLIMMILAIAIVISLVSLPITASAASVAYGAATVNSSSGLNLRSKANTSSSVVKLLDDGDIVVILDRTSSTWYKVNHEGSVGYVNTDFLENILTKENFNAAGQVTGSSVRMRSGPSTSDSIVGTYNKGTKMNVIGINEGWYKVQYNGKTGYIRSDYFEITGASGSSSNDTTTNNNNDSSSGESGIINASSVRLRKSASTSSAILDVLSKNSKITVYEKNGSWYKVSYNGTTGYVYASYVTVGSSSNDSNSDTSSDAKDGYINASSVRLRKSASTSSTILATMAKNSKVTVYEKSGDWYSVKYDGKKGYVYATYVTIGNVSDEDSGDFSGDTTEGYINGSSVRLRKSASTSSSVLAVMSKNSKVSIYKKSGDWYSVSYNGTKGYVYASYVSKGQPSTDNGSIGSGESTELGQKIANLAKSFVGYPYVYGAEHPSDGFDCSGLVYYVYGEYGYSLNRRASQQWYHGTKVSKSELQPGDLVFFSSDSSGITHVGIYLEGTTFVHASTPTKGVILSDLSSSYYQRVWYGARRIVG